MGIFKRLFGGQAGRASEIPPGAWLAAIGDIHGQFEELTCLLGKLEAHAKASTASRKILVFLGDYVDRGLKSKQVVDRLSDGFPGFETHFLRGNHDETLLQFLDDAKVADAWKNYGGLETLASYGVSRTRSGDWRDSQAEFNARLPDRHLTFFRDLEMYFELGDYVFVHAGLRPGIPLTAQSPHDMMWIREEFLNAKTDFGRIVVHGHTPKASPDVHANRIGIDTGAYMTRVLTALVLEGSTRRFVVSRAS
jgi:serine/threonine protein phosphatase 1